LPRPGLFFAFLFLSAFLLRAPVAFTQTSGDTLEALLEKVNLLEKQVKRIEETQKEILAKEDKILVELDRVRVWSHRN
jgi:Tfp pilus assembly protein PilN